jgi:hypothetical protein
LLDFVFEGRREKWLQIGLNVTDRQFHQYFECMETFLRLYDQHYENYMVALMHFSLGLDPNFLLLLNIVDEFGSVENEYVLDRAAKLRPWVLFVVVLEFYDQDDELVYIEAHITLFLRSLKISRVARRFNVQCDLPEVQVKAEFSDSIHVIGRFDHQRRRVYERKPGRPINQLKQRVSARTEIFLKRLLLK